MDEGGEMRVVAAGFAENADATAAARDLGRLLDVGEGDLLVGEIGGTSEFVNGHHAVLGARIRETRLDDAQAVIERHGGEVLADVPEAWAR